MDVMSFTHCFGLVTIILLFHNVALQETKGGNGIEKDVENNIGREAGSSIENEEDNMVNEDGDNTGNEKGDDAEYEEGDDDEYEEGNDAELELDDTENEEGDDAKNKEGDVAENEEGDDAENKEGDDTENEKPHDDENEEGDHESSDKSAAMRTPATFRWPSGTVPYRIKRRDYDSIVAGRIRQAMLAIERSSCVVFKDMTMNKHQLKDLRTPWLSIQNPDKERECSHKTFREVEALDARKAILVIGYDCMQQRDILHALLHVLGFRDEVTHPQRDLYIRIVWPNIQTKYRSLFHVQKGETPKKMVEFDSMSVMHFHDRAYTTNGGATILPQIPGLLIAPSDTLSQLDVMKLRLAFGHECNKRKVANLLRTCQNVLRHDDHEDDSNEYN